MHRITLLVLALTTSTWSRTSGELCRGSASKSNDGNWYCSEVKAITYRNISQPGAYNKTVHVDPDAGLCAHETIRYSGTGPLTPLFGELSMHLRGPMNVSQIAAYELSSSISNNKKREQKLEPQDKIINDSHETGSNGRNAVGLEAASVQFARERIDGKITPGQLLKRMNEPADTFATLIPPTNTASNTAIAHSVTNPIPTTLMTLARQEATTAPDPRVTAVAAAAWKRIAYYTSTAPPQATGFSFLANLGDDRKSGTFDYSFGGSLSYVTNDGREAASKQVPFDGTLETSEVEIAAFTDRQCEEDCDYYRPKSVAHHGWAGESKAFFIEFQMDHYDNVGTEQGMISDAPAWWFLNAAIPRVLQYGSDRNNVPCSCWSTGCGEFDAFEVLGRGEERAKSTMHRQGNLEGGDSNYFKRPVGKMLKFGVVFHNYNITATVLDDDFEFSQTLGEADIGSLLRYNPESYSHSLFAIGE